MKQQDRKPPTKVRLTQHRRASHTRAHPWRPHRLQHDRIMPFGVSRSHPTHPVGSPPRFGYPYAYFHTSPM